MAGAPVKVMSARLGNATTPFTMDTYMHVIPALADYAADQTAELIGERGPLTEDDGPNGIIVTRAELGAENDIDTDERDDKGDERSRPDPAHEPCRRALPMPRSGNDEPRD